MDAFGESFEDDFFDILSPLASLKEDNPDSFRFVCALRRDLGDPPAPWGPALELGSLPARDASLLLAEPLEYLGFRAGMYPRVDTVAAYANRYPLLIQKAGEELVDAVLSEKAYARSFSAADEAPPFHMKKEHLERALVEPGLLEKIMSDLKRMLDSDPRYLWMARCVAYMHYFEDNDVEIVRTEISLQQIQEVAESFNVSALTSLSHEELRRVARNLVGAGLLISNTADQYRLARSSMLDLLGEDSSALETILDNKN